MPQVDRPDIVIGKGIKVLLKGAFRDIEKRIAVSGKLLRNIIFRKRPGWVLYTSGKNRIRKEV